MGTILASVDDREEKAMTRSRKLMSILAVLALCACASERKGMTGTTGPAPGGTQATPVTTVGATGTGTTGTTTGTTPESNGASAKKVDCTTVRCAACPTGQHPSLVPPDCCRCASE